MPAETRPNYAKWELEVFEDEVAVLIRRRMAEMRKLKEETLLIFEPLPVVEGEAKND